MPVICHNSNSLVVFSFIGDMERWTFRFKKITILIIMGYYCSTETIYPISLPITTVQPRFLRKILFSNSSLFFLNWLGIDISNPEKSIAQKQYYRTPLTDRPKNNRSPRHLCHIITSPENDRSKSIGDTEIKKRNTTGFV